MCSETSCGKNIIPQLTNSSSLAELQSNLQDLSQDNSISNSDTVSLEVMPFPIARNNAARTHALPSAAYSAKGDSIACQDQDWSLRFATSYEHKPTGKRAESPCSTDIWAVRSSSTISPSPSSPPIDDILRDIIALTPCTTLSGTAPRTPSEEDPWRHNKSLEIPDLDHPMNRVRKIPNAVASGPTDSYYKSVTSSTPDDTIHISFPSQNQVQSRSVEHSRDIISSRREPTPIGTNALDRPRHHIPIDGVPKFQQAVKTSKGMHSPRGPPHSYVRPITMQNQYYFNQQQQQRQHHRRMAPHPQLHPQQLSPRLSVAYNHESLSPHYGSKNQGTHPPKWALSPHSQAGSKGSSVPNSPSNSSRQGSTVHHQRHHQHTVTSPSAGSGSRPTHEILKTLLRKKACLYEPGTSKAIALITWHVGRKLALTQGYFSRQHLQSGVHDVVSEKIDSGMITRTKVNRCMQIILNSCFHYIIPRPDGTEEKGDLFRQTFATTAVDDLHLLESLARPWNDLAVSDDFLVENIEGSNEKSNDEGSKRVVLLCFNENVRCADDVLRCHNDFIRDAAISGKLNLSAEEWRQFFSLKDDSCKSSDLAVFSPPSPPRKEKGGCNIPYLSFDTKDGVSNSLGNQHISSEPWSRSTDSLGQMTCKELSKFRTTWCCKRYDHDISLCQFAHVDVNQGWLRRNPYVYRYCDQICPHTTVIEGATSLLKGCHLNTCPNGLQCKFAHSQEEIDYHPNCYKRTSCDASKPSCVNCKLRDICPRSHSENPRSPGHSKSHRNKRGNDASSRKGPHHGSTKHSNVHSSSFSADDMKVPAPVIYHKPAPISEFEKAIFPWPGLQDLYRSNCAAIIADCLGKKDALLQYSNFGDYWDDVDADDLITSSKAKNNGFSLYSAVGGK